MTGALFLLSRSYRGSRRWGGTVAWFLENSLSPFCNICDTRTDSISTREDGMKALCTFAILTLTICALSACDSENGRDDWPCGSDPIGRLASWNVDCNPPQDCSKAIGDTTDSYNSIEAAAGVQADCPANCGDLYLEIIGCHADNAHNCSEFADSRPECDYDHYETTCSGCDG